MGGSVTGPLVAETLYGKHFLDKFTTIDEKLAVMIEQQQTLIDLLSKREAPVTVERAPVVEREVMKVREVTVVDKQIAILQEIREILKGKQGHMRRDYKGSVSLPAGQSVDVLADEVGAGELYCAFVRADNASIGASLYVDGSALSFESFTVLNTREIDMPALFWFISKFVASNYAAAITPSRPFPYSKSYRLSVTNRATSAANLLETEVIRFEYLD